MVVTITEGRCINRAQVEIFSENGERCFIDFGATIPQFICPDTPGDESLDCSFDPAFPAPCNLIFSGRVTANCDDNCCADNGTLSIRKQE